MISTMINSIFLGVSANKGSNALMIGIIVAAIIILAILFFINKKKIKNK